MPSTKRPRTPRTETKVHYSAIAPAGRPQDRSDNQAARVNVGDKEVMKWVQSNENAASERMGSNRRLIMVGDRLTTSRKYR